MIRLAERVTGYLTHLLSDLCADRDDFRRCVVHCQIVAPGFFRFLLGFGLRQLDRARTADHLCQEVLIAVTVEDQSRFVVGTNFKLPRNGEGALLQFSATDM